MFNIASVELDWKGLTLKLETGMIARQADGAVKKISSYITRKVADKLSSLFKSDRNEFEKKWNDIKIVIEY